MCDIAADGKAAEELMLGRTLTVSRARTQCQGLFLSDAQGQPGDVDVVGLLAGERPVATGARERSASKV